ncbi:MAG TPA: hypothetical protein VFA19_12815 [Gaiellaceae bacterium]|nr:hypothetical protein [Gaiellaceae bacterium]
MSDERDRKPVPKNDEGERDDDVEAHLKVRQAGTEQPDEGDDDVEAHLRVKQ